MNITSSPQISETVKEEIVRKHIEPSYIQEIAKLIKGKRDWKLVGQIFETTSKALVAIGGIVSFAAGSYDNFHLSFVAGAISTISLATLSFSSFGYKEQKKQGLELNNLLKKLKLDEVPVNERNVDDMYHSSMRQSSQTVYNPQREIQGLAEANNQLWQQNTELEKEVRYLKFKIEENDLEKLKERLKEVLKNSISTSCPNTPVQFMRRRISELESEETELKVHQEEKV